MTKISLSGCIILDKDKILLLNRRKTGWYELPGGKIKPDETPEETAIRELKEELLCDIEIVEKFGEKEFEENGFIMNYHWFVAKLKEEQEPKVGEPEVFDHLKYISLDTLQDNKLSPNMQNLLKEINNIRKFIK